MIIQYITRSHFIDAFAFADRLSHFTFDGLDSLFQYLEDMSEDLGESYELDVVGLCCEFTQYENIKAFNAEYAYNQIESIDELSDFTTFIDIDGEAFIVQEF